MKSKIVTFFIIYTLSIISMVWIDWRLIVPFFLFGWANNLENNNK